MISDKKDEQSIKLKVVHCNHHYYSMQRGLMNDDSYGMNYSSHHIKSLDAYLYIRACLSVSP